MRRISLRACLSFVLAFCMLVSMTTTAFAAKPTTADEAVDQARYCCENAQKLVDLIVEIAIEGDASQYFKGSASSDMVESIAINMIKEELVKDEYKSLVESFGFEPEKDADALAIQIYEVACIYYDELHRTGGGKESANKLAIIEIIRYVLKEAQAFSASAAQKYAEAYYEMNKMRDAEAKKYAEKELGFHEHSWKDATCTAPKTCATCGATEGKAKGHSWDAGKVTKEPTEKEDGVKTFTCGTCGETKTEKLPAVHTCTFNDATCTAPKTCPVCGATEGTAKGHSWKNATCTDPKTCSVCGATDGRAKGHSWKNATCTDPKTCSVCGVTDGSAKGHSWKDATCTAPKTCSSCGATEGSKLGHTYKDTVTAPTCTEKGYTTHTCSVCGDSYKDTEVAALDHTWDEGVVTSEPTENKTGTMKYTCKVCKATKSETIPALEHTHSYTEKVTAPTCTEKGFTTYTCSCGDSYIDDETSATGHDFENGKCTVCGEADPDYKPEAEQFELYGANMILGNNLAMNFYIEVADLDASEDYYAVITKENANGEDMVVTIQDENWQKYSSSLYRVSLDKVAAKEMADEVTVVIYNDEDEQVSKTWVDSVRDYTMRMLEKEEAKDDPNEEQLALYVEMLNYGAAAQVHFNYNEGDLANNELTAAQKAYGLSNVKMEDFRVKGTGYVGTNLTLESNILMNFFFNNIPAEHDDMYAIATYTDHYGEAKQIKVEGEDFVQHNSTTWKISVSGLVIADCRQLVDVKVYNSENEVIASAVDSIESYTARMDGDGPLFIAIMKFAVAAYNSFH